MPITVHAVRSVPKAATASIAMVTSEAVSSGVDGFDAAVLEAVGFEGKADQVHLQPTGGGFAGLVGLGPAAKVTAATVRRAAAVLARSCSRHARVAVRLTEDTGLDAGSARQALAEGAILGAYRYTEFKSGVADTDGDGGQPKLARVDVVGSTLASAKEALERGAAIAGAVCVARDLANEPGGSLTAPAFAEKTEAVAREAGLECRVWTREDIEAERLGGLLGVNRGSSLPPRFVELTYEPEGDPVATLAYVGKGITFDAGGLSIKTAQGMMAMKMDMCGAAAIIGAMSVLPVVDAPVRVKGYLPMTDNMLGGDATRPGDVLTTRSGKTIEVLNTDAEGRLILADALALACEDEPDAIVDLATLTGACMVALGPSIAGLMGNDEAFIDQVRVAADRAGERVWPLPLPADYAKQIESNVADIKNIGGNHGGALTAGLILKEFVDDATPWAHLDIAGPARAESDDAEITKGGTGFGVRTLIELASTFAPRDRD
ncbi:MAG: leucyl aminopeptidase [Acidimicrobiaceae bacterium]|nr:leucyl aminopeptidase [Acidimicrobiaceae bacterium]